MIADNHGVLCVLSLEEEIKEASIRPFASDCIGCRIVLILFERRVDAGKNTDDGVVAVWQLGLTA